MPSTIAWWVFESIAKRPALEALDQPHLPQRLVAVERLRETRAARRFSSRSPPGRGQRGRAHVEADVEVLVVGPLRPALAERHVRQPLPVARHHRQARLDVLDEVVVGRRVALEDHHARRRASAGSGPPGGGTTRRAGSVVRWPSAVSLLRIGREAGPFAVPGRRAATLRRMAPQKVVKSEEEWRAAADARAVRGAAREGDRAAWSGEYCELHAPGPLPLRGVRLRAVPVGHEVRVGQRLAELLPAGLRRRGLHRARHVATA